MALSLATLGTCAGGGRAQPGIAVILEISGLGLSLPEEEPGALYFVSKKRPCVACVFSSAGGHSKLTGWSYSAAPAPSPPSASALLVVLSAAPFCRPPRSPSELSPPPPLPSRRCRPLIPRSPLRRRPLRRRPLRLRSLLSHRPHRRRPLRRSPLRSGSPRPALATGSASSCSSGRASSSTSARRQQPSSASRVSSASCCSSSPPPQMPSREARRLLVCVAAVEQCQLSHLCSFGSSNSSSRIFSGMGRFQRQCRQ